MIQEVGALQALTVSKGRFRIPCRDGPPHKQSLVVITDRNAISQPHATPTAQSPLQFCIPTLLVIPGLHKFQVISICKGEPV